MAFDVAGLLICCPKLSRPDQHKYLLEEDQQDSERDSIVILRGMGRGRQARKTCPTVLKTVPVAGPSDQQDSERGTTVVLWGRGQGARSSSPLAIPVICTLADVMKERTWPLSQR